MWNRRMQIFIQMSFLAVIWGGEEIIHLICSKLVGSLQKEKRFCCFPAALKCDFAFMCFHYEVKLISKSQTHVLPHLHLWAVTNWRVVMSWSCTHQAISSINNIYNATIFPSLGRDCVWCNDFKWISHSVVRN